MRYTSADMRAEFKKRIGNSSLMICMIVLLTGCGASRAYVTLSDLDSRFEFLDEAGIEIALVDYTLSGVEKYNEFFKSCAIIYFASNVSHAMVNDATANLKKYAQDHLSKMTMDENIEELIGDTPHDDLSIEQSNAIMRMEKERGKLSLNEKKYFVLMAGQLAIGSLLLIRGIKETPDLLKSGRNLLTDVGEDFSHKGFPMFWLIPAVTQGIKESTERLNQVRKDAPELVEDIKILYDAFHMLS